MNFPGGIHLIYSRSKHNIVI